MFAKYSVKKVLWPAFGCAQHPKGGQNKQDASIRFMAISNGIDTRNNVEGWIPANEPY